MDTTHSEASVSSYIQRLFFIFFLIFYIKLKASLYFGRGFFVVIQLEFGAPRMTTESSQAERGCYHVYT